jgi:hypothetical protein
MRDDFKTSSSALRVHGDRHSAPVHLWRWLTEKSFELSLARNGFSEKFKNQRVGD